MPPIHGSFNTHKSYVNFGQTFKNGFTYEINAFQNYSDNDYYVNAPVENFGTGSIDRSKKERVKRFNDDTTTKPSSAERCHVDKRKVGGHLAALAVLLQPVPRHHRQYAQKRRSLRQLEHL